MVNALDRQSINRGFDGNQHVNKSILLNSRQELGPYLEHCLILRVKVLLAFQNILLKETGRYNETMTKQR